MALDLDSLLSNSNIDDEDDENDDHEHERKSLPHRTVEDILNDETLSSSSSSSPPSPKPLASSLDQYDGDYDVVSNKSVESLKHPSVPPPLPPQSFHRDRESENPDIRVSSLSPPPPLTSSRQLPPLFGSVRSSAKPGAALAAAAAASRSIPTPHAAAIKSRRSTALERRDSCTFSSSSSSSVSSLPLVISDEIVADERGFLNESVTESEDHAQLNGTAHRSYDSEEYRDFHDVVQEEGHEVESSSGVIKEERESDASGGLVDEGICGPDNPAGQGSGSIGDSNVVGDGEISEKEAKVMHETEIPTTEPCDVSRNYDADDVSLMSEIDELVRERIEQLDSKRNSEKSEKKSHKPSLKPLELAEEKERKQASTGVHLEEGAAAQPMRLEGVKRGSITLGYFDINSDNVATRTISSQAFRRDHGLPQVLAIHLNSIGIGMSKGAVLVVPSKYTAHHVDNMDSKITMLGSQGDRSSAAVTSICFNQQGDLLLAGYSDGHITVWDLQRGSAAKVITGEHTAPVVHAFFLGQDSQVTRQFKAVTGDCNGLVLLHSLSVVPLLNRFSIKTQCLLDGQKTGTVIAASPLLYDEFTGGPSLVSQGSSANSGSGFGSMMGGVVGGDASWKLFNEATALTEEGVVIFVTHQTALVVRLSPALKVYASLPRPDGVREGSMPYTAWKHMSQASVQSDNISEAAANERVALLAIAWDRKVQVAKLVNSELKLYKKWSLDGPAIGVAWLDDQILVALTVSGQLGLFARDGTIIHQTTFALDNLGGDDLITYNTYFVNVFGNPEKAYHNAVAVRGASIYILGPMHLIVSRLLPWKERIQVLRKAGDWMGALNMAMTLYDGQAHGVIDLPRTLDAVQDAIMPYLVDLLQSYVDEVFSYISVAFCNQMGKARKAHDQICGSSSLRNDIKEQFTRVGGVAVEFCVHINRTDILFDEIYSKFVAVQHRETFLELLEPYILKDMLSSLPPEIMQALVEHYSSKGWLQRVEQCVLHMDISSLDFNQVVKLCREHGLYCALVYLFNRGLDDYRSPLEELLVVYHNTPGESAAALGYRMLVYLKYCFLGLAFPPGHGSLPQSRLPSLRKELIHFLLEEANDSRVAAERSYINLYYLLELDTEATLDVLRCAFKESDSEKAHLPLGSSENQCTEGGNFLMEEIDFMVQDVVDTLVNFLNECIIEVEDDAYENRSVDATASRNKIGHLSEFIAYFVSCRRAMVSKDVLAQILQNLTSEYIVLQENSESHVESSKKREKQVLSLLKAVPESEWDADYVLHLCEKAKFYQVCGFIHTIKDQDISALDSYMKDVDEPVHAFAFINDTLSRLNETESAAFRSAIISRVPTLVDLSREGTFFLVMDHFTADFSDILSELQSQSKSLFLYLKTVVEVHQSGILDFSTLTRGVDGHIVKAANGPVKGLNAYMEKISEFPKLLRNNPVPVSDDMMEHYLELLCQYERRSVLKFLETFDSYRVEHCLRLCQEYGIVDAAAFLLERVGDVGSALSLTLSSLNDKFEKLDVTLRRIFSGVISSGSVGAEYFNTVSKLEEVSEIHQTLHDCIELCQRNTPRLNPEESEILWFRLLDTFCEPLMGSSDSKAPSHEDTDAAMLIESVGSQGDDIGSIIKWRISKGVAPVLRKLFSQLIKEIVEGMIGYVRLPNIVSKLLSDNGSQEFGDFKLTILGMLGTYGFERRILDTAKSLIEDDTFYTMILLKRGASHGYSPRSPICCLCNCPLAKKSSPSGVRLFSCGHSTHIHCEILGGETSSKGSSSGCPICLPKNNQKSRTKGVLAESGLVTGLSYKSPQVHGINNLHVYENQNDGSDGSYGLQQAPRFDILANLRRDNGLIQIENLPQLKLAPPAVYHEKVKQGINFLNGENSSDVTKIEKPSKNRPLKEIKAKGSSIRFPLKTNIFGKERTSKR